MTAPSQPRPPDVLTPRTPEFMELLRAQVREAPAGSGRFAASVTVDQRHLRDLGIVHGGVLASLLDTAMGVSVSARAPAGHFAVTVQLNVNFIRPAWLGETVTAIGEVTHRGRQTAVARGEVRTDKGVLVASGSGTFMYILHTDSGQEQFARHADAPAVSSGVGEDSASA